MHSFLLYSKSIGTFLHCAAVVEVHSVAVVEMQASMLAGSRCGVSSGVRQHPGQSRMQASRVPVMRASARMQTPTRAVPAPAYTQVSGIAASDHQQASTPAG